MKNWVRLGFLGLIIGFYLVLSQWPDTNLHLVVCDVGQGDAILITQGFWQVLIDGGPDDSVQKCLNQHLPFWDRTIELVVVTHFDKDHIGGLPGVIDRFQTKEVLISQWGRSQTTQKLKKSLQKQSLSKIKIKEPVLGTTVGFPSGGKLKVLSPAEPYFAAKIATAVSPKVDLTELILSDKVDQFFDEAIEGNDRSIVLLLEFNQFKGLLMGDASQKVELALLKQGLIQDIDWLKVGHHGAKTSTSLQFLHATRPEICTISCGNSNAFGHPAGDIVAKLMHEDCIVWRTDQKGTIELVTDGSAYWIAEQP
ncbi:MAG: MBL fold metallo-hydrolase [Candidatus Pacebacteria bacterium]|nr:MBL fold metallo-hydrolase [Candidatus Paceibacterota bacterium]